MVKLQVQKYRDSLARLADALADPRRGERTVIWLLLAYTVVWTLYGILAKSSQDLHFDMAELVGLLGRYLDGEKRAAGLLLLTVIPFFNLHELKFNLNTLLIPLWAVTTLWFIRSFETRSRLYAALAGLGAAACMLGKYWSIFLLAGLALAALLDPRRRVYFRSPAPYLTIGIGLLALAPHLAWLVTNDFSPFTFALDAHGRKSFAAAVIGTLSYLAGSAAYAAQPVALVIWLFRPPAAGLRDSLWPASAERRLPAAAFWATLLLPLPVALMALRRRSRGVWRETTDRPLLLVGGDAGLAYGAAFYLPQKPSVFARLSRKESPWVDDARLAREGIAAICRALASSCIKVVNALAARSPAGQRNEIEVARNFLGMPGAPERYLIVTMPPR